MLGFQAARLEPRVSASLGGLLSRPTSQACPWRSTFTPALLHLSFLLGLASWGLVYIPSALCLCLRVASELSGPSQELIRGVLAVPMGVSSAVPHMLDLAPSVWTRGMALAFLSH